MAGPALNLLPVPLVPASDKRWIARVAHGLRALGRRPVVLDAGGGQLATAFGLRLRHDLLDLLEGERDFDAVAQATTDGIHVLRADRGVEAYVSSGAPAAQLLGAFGRLSHGFDDLVLAMPAGELACLADPEATVPLVGLEPTPNGRVQAYALVKQLAQGFGYRRFACVVLDVADQHGAAGEQARLAAAAERFLQVEVALAGWLPARGPSHLLAAALERLVQPLQAAAPRPHAVN